MAFPVAAVLQALPAVLRGVRDIAIKRDPVAIAENKQAASTKNALPAGVITAGVALAGAYSIPVQQINNEAEMISAIVGVLVSVGMYFYRAKKQ